MTRHDFTKGPLCPAEVEALIAQAHEARAQAMREMLSGFLTRFKRVAARLRPNRQRLPQSGAWDWHH